jgi:hypothetical protein
MVSGISPKLTTYTSVHYITANYDSTLSDRDSDPIQLEPVHNARLLTKAYQKYLNEWERDFLRMVNQQPSLDGIAACLHKHRFTLPPVLAARHSAPLNRRITCWRSTRWKSLSGRIWLKKVRCRDR